MRWRHMHFGIYRRGRGEIFSMICSLVSLDIGDWEGEVFSSKAQLEVSGIRRKEEGDVLHVNCRCANLEFGKERRRGSLHSLSHSSFW